MMASEEISGHYSIDNILESIEAGLLKTGKSRDSVTVDDLSLVDEFHIGGRAATEHFFPQLGLRGGQRVLDIGCGIGGGSRFAAENYGALVDGIDLTASYIEAGRRINEWVDMGDRVNLTQGDATNLSFSNESFDVVFTMHVCMNIPDKLAVFREAFRVLKPGGIFGVYDITKYGDGILEYPVPWATDASMSFLATSDGYVSALKAAGFEIETVLDRHEFAIEFFEAVKARMANADGPPPLGIHVHMGEDAPAKVTNLTSNLVDGLVAPFEFISRKP